jgi:hypothetical protein
MPCGEGLLGEPHRDAPPPDQRGIAFLPVRHLVSGFGDLVTAAFVESCMTFGLHGDERRTANQSPGTIANLTTVGHDQTARGPYRKRGTAAPCNR